MPRCGKVVSQISHLSYHSYHPISLLTTLDLNPGTVLGDNIGVYSTGTCLSATVGPLKAMPPDEMSNLDIEAQQAIDDLSQLMASTKSFV